MRIYVRISRAFQELVFFYFFKFEIENSIQMRSTWESHVSFRSPLFVEFCKILNSIQMRIYVRILREFYELLFYFFKFEFEKSIQMRSTLESHVSFMNSYFLTFIKFCTRCRWEGNWEYYVCFRYLYFFTLFIKLDSDENMSEKLTWVLGTCIFLFF